MVLPQDYQDKMRELLMDDYDRYLESFDHPVGQSLRVNLLKTEPAELFRRLSICEGDHPGDALSGYSPDLFRPVPWCPSGAWYDGKMRLSLSPYYQAGLYYIQEPSAMAPASFLPVSPGDRVLDLCAAPGGKTTALGAKLRGKGLLVANDVSISRCQALLKNVQLAGLMGAMVTCEDSKKLVLHFPGYFDAILVDAPCSGEGMFRRDPAMVKGWSQKEVLRYQQLQKEILSAAASMVRPGGHILYSTCTYSPEENEQVVETLLARRQFELIPLPEYEGVDVGHPEWSISGDPSLTRCVRFWNHQVRGEGQFAALLRKMETAGAINTKDAATGATNTKDAATGAINKKDAATEATDTKDAAGTIERIETEERTKTAGKTTLKDRSKLEDRTKLKNRVETTGKKPLPKEFLTFMKRVRWPGQSGRSEMEAPGQSGRSGTDASGQSGRSETGALGQSGRSGTDASGQSGRSEIDVLGIPGKVLQLGERLFLLPEDAPDVSGIRVVSSGLHLGNCKKNRFEPGQALALALRADGFDNVLRLSPFDERVERYLRCETLELSPPAKTRDSFLPNGTDASRLPGMTDESCLKDGWCLICLEEYPLGWGKISHGRVKNKYPPGWRRS